VCGDRRPTASSNASTVWNDDGDRGDLQPQTNGFVERFNRTVLDEFFRTAFRTTLYESVEALQADLDAWLRSYNTERPHHGYRNLGRRPMRCPMSLTDCAARPVTSASISTA